MFILKALGAFALIIAIITALAIALLVIPVLLPEARPYLKQGWAMLKDTARDMIRAPASA